MTCDTSVPKFGHQNDITDESRFPEPMRGVPHSGLSTLGEDIRSEGDGEPGVL